MVDTLVSIHSEFRWLVLVVLVVALVGGLYRWWRPARFTKKSARPFAVALILLDIQVLLGLLVWISGHGWELGAFRAWVHPVGMIIALGVGHALIGQAIKSEGSSAYRNATLGMLVTLAIVAATIPRDAWVWGG